MTLLNHLTPARVFHYFEELCGIPHGSGNTKAISDYCVRFAKKLAKEKQCKLLYIHDRLFNLPGAVNLHDVTPGQWLGLFANADYVVTNSFHGTVFSINFNKQFFVRFIPRSIANTRIQCVLEEYGLFHREIDSLDNTRCEYQTANTILAKNREHSLEFLRNRIIGV